MGNYSVRYVDWAGGGEGTCPWPGSRTGAELGAKSCWIPAQASYAGAMGIAAALHSLWV